MYRILILFLLISVNANSKGYTVEITVYEANTKKVLKGVTVRCHAKKSHEAELTSNEEGKVVFTGVKGKQISFTVMPLSGDYELLSVSISNFRKNDVNHSAFVNWTKDKWDKEFEIIKEEHYAKFIQLTNTDPTLVAGDCDTITFGTDATFPGGKEALQNYINYNVVYPEKAVLMEDQGKVFVSFVIELDGSISTIKIVKGVSKELDRESKRVIRSMPKFIPSFCNGEPVRTRIQLPIIFSLN